MRKFVAMGAAVLCVIALGACSSGSNKASTTSTGSSRGSSAGSSSGGSTSVDTKQFCLDLIKASDTIGRGGGNIGSDAREALAVFSSVKPPAELASVWDDWLKGIEEASKLSSNDSAGAAQVGIRHAQAFAKVGQFIGTSCAAVAASDFSSSS